MTSRVVKLGKSQRETAKGWRRLRSGCAPLRRHNRLSVPFPFHFNCSFTTRRKRREKEMLGYKKKKGSRSIVSPSVQQPDVHPLASRDFPFSSSYSTKHLFIFFFIFPEPSSGELQVPNWRGSQNFK